MSQLINQSILTDSPFNLADDGLYAQWRKEKLRYNKPTLADLFVDIEDPFQLSHEEKVAITQRCNHFNMALYRLSDAGVQDKALVHALGQQLGLNRLDANLRSDEDSVTSLEVREQAGNQYIPYTNKALSWHTDGYYNFLDKQIFAIIMHCVRQAAEGGENFLLNPESVYIALRDKNPAYIAAMMHPEAMTIPENIESGEVIRDAQTGPVFMVNPGNGQSAMGRLHMRFSARKRNIIWRDTAETREAVEMINRQMADAENVVKVALKAGEGVICNNVLHNRTGFTDSEDQKRLIYRARYYDAVG
jgi:alpha-ketoglutarate-dependent taurine dioxygenase